CLAHVPPPLGRRERRRVWHGPSILAVGRRDGDRYHRSPARVAQSAEHLTRNEKVKGSIPFSGSGECRVIQVTSAGWRRSWRRRQSDGPVSPWNFAWDGSSSEHSG